MARRKGGERVLGPYEHKRGGRVVGYRVISLDAQGKRTPDYFATRKEAEEFARLLRVKLSDHSTLEGALAQYRKHMLDSKENQSRSADTTIGRLTAFFGDDQLVLWSLSIDKLREIYKQRTKAMVFKGKNTPRQKISTSTHRNELCEAKTFLRWACKQGLVPSTLVARLDEVQGTGRRRKGKQQHRVDDARRWYAKALQMAQEHDGAVAALCTLVFDLRCSEAINLQVRNVDDGGRLLHVWKSKTEAGARDLGVSEVMRPLLLRLCKDKLPSAWLFSSPRAASGHPTRDWPRKWVKRICRAARVPQMTAHGMRGLHSTLATRAGITPQVIAESMGHTNPRVTKEHYINPEVAAQAEQQRVLDKLETKTAKARCGNTGPSGL